MNRVLPCDETKARPAFTESAQRMVVYSELGGSENRPEEQGNHADVRNEMKRIFALIDGVVPERSSLSER